MDHIDLTVCRVFSVSPEILTARIRKGRAVDARFAAIYIRHERGAKTADLAFRYERDEETIRHAVKEARNRLKHSPEFRNKYNLCLQLVNDNKEPYNSSRLSEGAKVWSRPDSQGSVIEGTVTQIGHETFTVESFEDPDYRSVHRISDGRVTPLYETSRDVVSIRP